MATSFQVEKIYKEDDEWKSTDNFNLDELLQLQAAIDKQLKRKE